MMARRYAESVEVRRHDRVPRQFIWRERHYVVRDVLASWMEAGGWWRGAATVAALTGDDVDACTSDDLVVATIPASPKWGERAWGEPAPDVAASVGPIAVDDREREVWRVEASVASSGRCGAGTDRSTGRSGVYDLSFDEVGGTWTVARVLD